MTITTKTARLFVTAPAVGARKQYYGARYGAQRIEAATVYALLEAARTAWGTGVALAVARAFS